MFSELEHHEKPWSVLCWSGRTKKRVVLGFTLFSEQCPSKCWLNESQILSCLIRHAHKQLFVWNPLIQKNSSLSFCFGFCPSRPVFNSTSFHGKVHLTPAAPSRALFTRMRGTGETTCRVASATGSKQDEEGHRGEFQKGRFRGNPSVGAHNPQIRSVKIQILVSPYLRAICTTCIAMDTTTGSTAVKGNK